MVVLKSNRKTKSGCGHVLNYIALLLWLCCTSILAFLFFRSGLSGIDIHSLAAVTTDTPDVLHAAKVEGVVNSSNNFIQLVQIGANDGSTAGNDDKVRKLLLSKSTKAVLVEANPQVYPLLLKTLQETYGSDHENDNDNNNRNIVPMNALVCPPSDSNVIFYIVNTTKLTEACGGDKHLPHWVLYQISSLEKSSIVEGLRFFLHNRRNLRHLKPADFVEEKPMPCTPFGSVLSQNKIAPETVDVLVIDVEGRDVPLLLEALRSLLTLRPAMIVFELKFRKNNEETRALFALLEERGYTHDCPVGNCRQDDVTSILPGSKRLAQVQRVLQQQN